MISIPILGIVGPHCGTYDQGVKVFRAIYQHLRNGEKIELNFCGIELTTSSFISGAISNLLQEFSDKNGNLPISFVGLSSRDAFIMKRTLQATRLQQLDSSSPESPDTVLTP